MIPLPSKMYMTGDQASNWEFFKDSWKNYATATKLDQKDKKIVAARYYWSWVKNAFMSAEISLWPKKKDKMLMLSSQSLTNILCLNKILIQFMNGIYSTVILRNLVKALISSWLNSQICGYVPVRYIWRWNASWLHHHWFARSRTPRMSPTGKYTYSSKSHRYLSYKWNGSKSTTQNGTNWLCSSCPRERNSHPPCGSTQESSQDQKLQILQRLPRSWKLPSLWQNIH